MAMIVDIHVHLHSFYDHAVLWDHAWQQLARWKQTPLDHFVLCIMDADDQAGFVSLAEGRWPLGRWKLVYATADELELAQGSARIWVLAGRQLVSCEGIEVLTLGHRCVAQSGQPLFEIVQCLRDHGQPIILPWAPGKWWGARGRVLEELLHRNTEGLALADSSLRPRGYSAPKLLRRAVGLGIPIVAGSDPLYHPTEWTRIGTYVTRLNESVPASNRQLHAWLTTALCHPTGPRELLGRRPGWTATFIRLWRHMRARRG